MTNRIFRYLLSFIFVFLILDSSFAIAKPSNELPFQVQYIKDKTNQLNINQVVNEKFTNYDKDLLNFGVEDATIWIKLVAQEQQTFHRKLIFIEQPRFVVYEMYDQKQARIARPTNTFEVKKDSPHKNLQNIAFLLPDTVKKGEAFYLKLKAHEAFITKMVVIEEKQLDEKNSLKDIIFGIYTGIMLVMFVYNLFLFIIVRDRS